jgi:hypothetical protein
VQQRYPAYIHCGEQKEKREQCKGISIPMIIDKTFQRLKRDMNFSIEAPSIMGNNSKSTIQFIIISTNQRHKIFV